MKIVFSRKGFDSATGGAPSPIIDNRPCSIPIPAKDRSETTYENLCLGKLVEDVTRGNVLATALCHNDPMFERGRCAFGQTSAAQGHLAKQKVGIGDTFLFFGLFSHLDGKNRHHRIYGYLNVEEVIHLGAKPDAKGQPHGFSLRHPHVVGQWNPNNTLYVGPGRTANRAEPELRLTVQGGPLTLWNVPSWLKEAGLSYHGNRDRWKPNNTLSTVSRGQEFVTDVSDNEDAKIWLDKILNLICNEVPGSPRNE